MFERMFKTTIGEKKTYNYMVVCGTLVLPPAESKIQTSHDHNLTSFLYSDDKQTSCTSLVNRTGDHHLLLTGLHNGADSDRWRKFRSPPVESKTQTYHVRRGLGKDTMGRGSGRARRPSKDPPPLHLRLIVEPIFGPKIKDGDSSFFGAAERRSKSGVTHCAGEDQRWGSSKIGVLRRWEVLRSSSSEERRTHSPVFVLWSEDWFDDCHRPRGQHNRFNFDIN